MRRAAFFALAVLTSANHAAAQDGVSTAATLAAPAATPPAAISITGNVGLTSDYAFRGISQTLREPALQGGLDVAVPFGFYAGIWGSSLNFGEDLAAGPRAQVEVDLVAGLARTAFGVSWQLAGIYYAYPGAASARNYDFVELAVGAGRDFGFASIKATAAISPDYFAASGNGVYFGGSASIPLPLPLGASIDVAAGRQIIEDHAAFGADDYTHWQAGVSAVLFGIRLTGAYVTTDLSATECFNGLNLCEGRAVLSFTRSR